MRLNALIFILLFAVVGCSKNPSAEELIDRSVFAITKGDSILNVVTEASCEGPKGKYTTTVHSADSGYTYFKQTYSYRDVPFEAVIVNDSGFILSNDSIVAVLDRQTIVALRSHEFHTILIDLKTRFHQFSNPEKVSDQRLVKTLDELNNPVEIYFNNDSPEIRSITMRNPGDTTEQISWTYSDWKLVRGYRLPMHVSIKQGSDKNFSFDFSTVEINSKNFKRWQK